MADPTKEELEMMARMILGKDYNPDFDPRSLGKREDQTKGKAGKPFYKEPPLEPAMAPWEYLIPALGGRKAIQSMAQKMYKESMKSKPSGPKKEGPPQELRTKIYKQALESRAADLDMVLHHEEMFNKHGAWPTVNEQPVFWEVKPGDYGYDHAKKLGHIGPDGKVWYTEF
tara:strand:+ start:1389 stop:1901 length:513 start_codon:yes stop_codon:yes gene_type:complete